MLYTLLGSRTKYLEKGILCEIRGLIISRIGWNILTWKNNILELQPSVLYVEDWMVLGKYKMSLTQLNQVKYGEMFAEVWMANVDKFIISLQLPNQFQNNF